MALVAAKIDAGTPDPQGGKIEKDAGGKPTGVVRGAGGVAFVAARIPLQTQEAGSPIPASSWPISIRSG